MRYYFADQIFSEKEVADLHLPPIRGPFDGFPYTSLKYEIILMYIHCRIFHSSKFPLIPFIVPRTLMRILNNTFVFHEWAKLCPSGKKTFNVLGSRFIVGSAFTTIADNSFTDFFGINNRNSYGCVKAPLRLSKKSQTKLICQSLLRTLF